MVVIGRTKREAEQWWRKKKCKMVMGTNDRLS